MVTDRGFLAFVINGIAYIGTGYDPVAGATSDFYAYDPVRQYWESIALLPGIGRQYCTSFSFNGIGYVCTGRDRNWQILTDTWAYDLVEDKWTQKTPLPGKGRFGSAYFQIGSKAYICSGYDNDKAMLRELWEYDMANDAWRRLQDLSFPGRFRASATALHGKGYLFLGITADDSMPKQVYEYDQDADTWILIDEFPFELRYYTTAVAVNNSIVLGLGYDGVKFYDDLYAFEPSTREWKTLSRFAGGPRRGNMYFVLNDEIYITSGMDQHNDMLNDTWKSAEILSVRPASIDVFTIFPQPANDLIYVKPSPPSGTTYSLNDLKGNQILIGSIDASQIRFDRYVVPGAYVLQVFDASGSILFRKKLFIVK